MGKNLYVILLLATIIIVFFSLKKKDNKSFPSQTISREETHKKIEKIQEDTFIKKEEKLEVTIKNENNEENKNIETEKDRLAAKNVAKTFEAKKDYQGGIEYFTQLEQTVFNKIELAKLLILTEQNDHGEEILEEVLLSGEHPDNSLARDLAELYARDGKPEKAEEFLLKYMEIKGSEEDLMEREEYLAKFYYTHQIREKAYNTLTNIEEKYKNKDTSETAINRVKEYFILYDSL